jgi:hypothetical protein
MLLVDQRSSDSLGGVANRIMAGRTGFESRQDRKCASAPTPPTMSLGPADPSTEWVLELLRGRKMCGS